MQITFLGAIGTVTGSKYLVTQGKTKLLVDCGLFQGLKVLRLRNRQPPPVQPSELSAIVLTHAHVDHSGYLPVMLRDGYRGKVHMTPPTRALCELLLPDSGHLQEEDARYAAKKGFSKHANPEPLYTEADARHALTQLASLDPGKELEIGELSVRLVPAGHILGASSVIISDGRKKVLFSGDLGRPEDVIMYPPEPPEAVDCIIMESTYGDREHTDRDPIAALAPIVQHTVDRGGVLLVPSFAVGRAQALLYCLHEVFERGLAPEVPVFLNSPMATRATDIYTRYAAYHRLTPKRCADVFDRHQFVTSVEQSKALNRRRGPMVVLSASGMLTGGRVLHHVKAFGPHHQNTILLAGYQAPGTRGGQLARGAESVKIHGSWVPIKAKVRQIDVLSAHADRSELFDWLRSAERPPGRVMLTHGDHEAADSLRMKIAEDLGLDVHVPDQNEVIEV